MEEMKHNETRRGYALIGVLGITVLAILMLVSIAGAAPYAYVANSGSNTVSVIDVVTNTVTATVPVGIQPMGVAATLDGKKIYVTNLESTVSVIDTSTNTVIATVNVGVPLEGLNIETLGVAVTPDGTKAYVASAYNIVGYNGIVSVIDTTTNKVIATVPVGAWPTGVAVSPDGKKVYVTNQDSNTVSVIDTTTNTVIATVNGLDYPGNVAVTPDGTKLYALNNNNTISVIDTTTSTVIAMLDIVSSFCGIAFTPDGKKAYVTGYDNDILVIDTATNTVTANVTVGRSPSGVAVTPDGRKVYVANYDTDDVSVIDTATNAVIARVNVGDGPGAIGQSIGTPPVQPIYPIANFSSNITSGYVPLTVQFTDFSENETSRNWDFENDGIIDSTEEAPVYVYTNPGTYTVNLTASNENGTDSKQATIIVLKQPLPPVASFRGNITSGYSPLTVQFTDLSADATEWNWNFGDKIHSTEQNPVHMYIKSGKYTVSLTVKNSVGTDTVVKDKYISVSKIK